MQLFHYLKYALAIILGFIGLKMLVHDFFKIPIGIALVVVFGLLVFAIIASMISPKKDRDTEKAEIALEPTDE
jgi:tellurite resistance protein TerC